MTDDFFADLDPRACGQTRAAVGAAVKDLMADLRDYAAVCSGQKKHLAEMLATDHVDLGVIGVGGFKVPPPPQQSPPLDDFLMVRSPEKVADVCGLDEKALTALKAKIAARDKAIEEWSASVNKVWQDLMQGPTKATNQFRCLLYIQPWLIEADAAADIVASLTDDQRETWLLHAGYLKVLEVLKQTKEPDADKIAAIKAALAAYRQETRAAQSDSREDEKVRAAAQAGLEAALLKTLGPLRPESLAP
jgi:hypothetical protein